MAGTALTRLLGADYQGDCSFRINDIEASVFENPNDRESRRGVGVKPNLKLTAGGWRIVIHPRLYFFEKLGRLCSVVGEHRAARAP